LCEQDCSWQRSRFRGTVTARKHGRLGGGGNVLHLSADGSQPRGSDLKAAEKMRSVFLKVPISVLLDFG
jgi:hypothetical protein